MHPNRIEHLRMVQTVIERMANCSFLFKGWTVTLVSGLAVFAEGKADKAFLWLPLFPVVVFWLLDAYYLRQERLFRKVFDHVRSGGDTDTDFSMNPSAFLKQVPGLIRMAFSKSLGWFYLPLLVVPGGVAMLRALQ